MMWEERYRNAEGFAYGEVPNAYLVRQASRLERGMKALAVADGEGRNGVWLAGVGLDVWSVDGSPTAVERARRLADQRKVSIRADCADLGEWAWPRQAVDVVVAIFAHFEPGLRERVHHGMQTALRPGGQLILQGFHTDQLEFQSGGPRRRDMLFSAELLRDDFRELEMVELLEYQDAIDEGPFHQGRAALVGMVARKPA